MHQNPETTQQLLRSVLQKQINHIGILVYRYKGELSWDGTPLQLRFTDGSVLFFDSDGDGESLRIRTESWEDPFSGDLLEENQQYIEEYGKWEYLDLTQTPPFNTIVGETIRNVLTIYDAFDKLVGVTFDSLKHNITALVEFDETLVFWNRGYSSADIGNIIGQ